MKISFGNIVRINAPENTVYDLLRLKSGKKHDQLKNSLGTLKNLDVYPIDENCTYVFSGEDARDLQNQRELSAPGRAVLRSPGRGRMDHRKERPANQTAVAAD